jgi:hypothetical protein
MEWHVIWMVLFIYLQSISYSIYPRLQLSKFVSHILYCTEQYISFILLVVLSHIQYST